MTTLFHERLHEVAPSTGDRSVRRRIPFTPKDISPAWMSSHLGKRYTQVTVREIPKFCPGRVFDVLAQSNNPAVPEVTLIVKIPGVPLTCLADTWTVTRETYVYERLETELCAPTLLDSRVAPIEMNPVVFSDSGKAEDDTPVACVCLSDVTRVPPRARKHHVKTPTWISLHKINSDGGPVKAVVGAVAHVHARYWNRTMVRELEPLPQASVHVAGDWLRDALPEFLEAFGEHVSPLTNYLLGALAREFNFVYDPELLRQPPHTLCHNNLTPDCIWVDREDEPLRALITDWEAAACNCPGVDLAMVFTSCMSHQVRQTKSPLLVKHYMRGLARNGVPAPQRQETNIYDMMHRGLLLILPRLVTAHIQLQSLTDRFMEESEGELRPSQIETLQSRKEHLSKWITNTVAWVDELEKEGILTRVLIDFAKARRDFIPPARMPVFNLLAPAVDIRTLNANIWQRAKTMTLASSGRSHDTLFVMLDNAAVALKFSYSTAREFLVARIGCDFSRSCARVRVMLRFSEEWSACMQAIKQLVSQSRQPIDSQRVEGYRFYPILLVSEFVSGGWHNNLENFVKYNSCPFVPPSIRHTPAVTPRGVPESNVLTEAGWRLIFEIGKLVAFVLFINNAECMPIAHVWHTGKPKNFIIERFHSTLTMVNYTFVPPRDKNHLRSVKRFLAEAYVPADAMTNFSNEIRKQLQAVWQPTLSFFQEYLEFPQLTHNVHVLRILSEGLRRGMEKIIGISPADLKAYFQLIKAGVMPATANSNTIHLGSYPLKMLSATVTLEETDLDALLAMKSVYASFLSGHGSTDATDQRADNMSPIATVPSTAATTKFGLPENVAQMMLRPQQISKVTSPGHEHVRLVQLSLKGTRLVWSKPGEKGEPPKRKGLVPLAAVTSLRLSVDPSALMLLEIEWPDHLVVFHDIPDSKTLRNLAVCLPHLVRFHQGVSTDLMVSSSLFECIADPERFVGSNASPQVLKRAKEIEMPISVDALAALLSQENPDNNS
eukprot:c20225_g1_i3.p1 GENE.c20225_g1_i3~~c20225_g1_i3.p1  ORF type:complete len:1004 (-),score=216.75 c20225_g1_i3:104-3115(-)